MCHRPGGGRVSGSRDFPDEAERDAWVHKLANLVLLTRRKNAGFNADFDEKKERYFSARAGVANFALTNQVLATQAWTRGRCNSASTTGGRLAEYWRLN
ncbi:MAG: HNH endonuclease family protein [Alphaproteobacteria bacterium]